MRVIYFSADYTTHDWRYLDKLAQTNHQVWYLRLGKGPVELEKQDIPAGIKLVEWAGGNLTEKQRENMISRFQVTGAPAVYFPVVLHPNKAGQRKELWVKAARRFESGPVSPRQNVEGLLLQELAVVRESAGLKDSKIEDKHDRV